MNASSRDDARDPRPRIDTPRDAVPMPLLIGIVLVLALGLFLYLNANRQALVAEMKGPRTGASAMRLPAPPPELIVPPPPPEATATPAPAAVASPVPQAQPIAPRPVMVSPSPAASPAASPAPRLRGNEPALVVDLTAGSGAQVNATAAGGAATADVAGDDAVRATLIRNRSSIIPQGAIIAAVLETPLNSDRPGLARAIVSQDVRSFDGSRVLIPRGSRLIGEFKADTSASLRRVLVTWTRLIRPDGVAIRISSPVTDAMGGAGVPGRVNTHFLERFGSAVLQSALTIGVNLASVPRDSGAVYVGLPAAAAQVGQTLAPTTQRPPTVKVREGAQIAVLVARDLDFGGTPAVR
jgi:type IV secretion system protein VirB10